MQTNKQTLLPLTNNIQQQQLEKRGGGKGGVNPGFDVDFVNLQQRKQKPQLKFKKCLFIVLFSDQVCFFFTPLLPP